ncbi:SIRT6 [Cordylochernes scorpioides]|uniref:protein acetyllysine N-acetyltransferase n=1 Tax=Cordylochernes scorpioides TaxID=51811 RepID=A0ABY6KUJ3_9ARAC|nr:SIRT6 [Cordylochernes scorpioides]
MINHVLSMSLNCPLCDPHRGPKGVWTLEKKGERPPEDVSFDRATPTFAHRFLRALAATRGKGVSVVSQNIDGLHLRSGLRAPQLYELHGNMFLDQCDNCARFSSYGFLCTLINKRNKKIRPNPNKLIVTSPLPVPSPDEKGGGGAVTSSLKNLGSAGPADSTL